ncbi:MAG: hypothetical protein AB7F22_31670 [Reyranella sp.]|uniref:hypothetical protein n=1 Tax=Reyranella sp. TaxID=1929291 RepID=UPI003D11BF7D
MHIDQFDLRAVTFEVRYERNLNLWDRPGRYWNSWLAKYPDIKINSATPNEVQAIGPNVRAMTGLDRSFIIANRPENLKDLEEKATLMVDLLGDVLEVAAFNRLGFRTVYRRRFADKQEAAAAMINVGLLKVPTASAFGIENATVLHPEYAVKLEGEDFGVRVAMKAQELKITIETSGDVEEEMAPKQEDQIFQDVIFDLDYYTLKPVLMGQLRVSERPSLLCRHSMTENYTVPHFMEQVYPSQGVTSIAERTTCTAIWRSSISATATA